MRRFGMPGRSRLFAAIAMMTCLAAACGGGTNGSPTGPGGGGNGGIAGDYLLVGAGGNAVPAIVNSPICGPSQVQDGSLTLRADGTFQMRFNWQDDLGADYAADHGSYRQDGTRLEFTSEAWGDHFEGQIAGGLLDLTWDFCNDNLGPELELTFAH